MVHSIHSIPHPFAELWGALSPPPPRADGRKRWIIIPPERWDIADTNNANMPIHLWLKTKYHQIQEKHPGLFWEFIQEPGEILYIPKRLGVWHPQHRAHDYRFIIGLSMQLGVESDGFPEAVREMIDSRDP